jgi:hypothetical protein
LSSSVTNFIDVSFWDLGGGVLTDWVNRLGSRVVI